MQFTQSCINVNYRVLLIPWRCATAVDCHASGVRVKHEWRWSTFR